MDSESAKVSTPGRGKDVLFLSKEQTGREMVFLNGALGYAAPSFCFLLEISACILGTWFQS